MKKLMITNVVLYGFMYSLSMLNIGLYYGARWNNYYRPGLEGVVLPIVHLILLLWGLYLLHRKQHVTPLGYCSLGVVTLLHMALLLAFSFIASFMHHGTWPDFITPNGDWYWIAVLILSLVICVIYIVCAVLTNREYKEIRRKRREAASQ